MTRKHFDLIATTLRHLGSQGSLCFDSADDRLFIARAFADELVKFNHRFDRTRFIRASLLPGDLDKETGGKI